MINKEDLRRSEYARMVVTAYLTQQVKYENYLTQIIQTTVYLKGR